MKGDYSRDTFDPAKHFSRVLMQQGRVQLDADWNEQGAILLHYLQTLAADLIGPSGGPADQLGFEIRPVSPENDKTKLTDLFIGYGRYYVDGILCENLDRSSSVHASRAGIEMVPRANTGAAGARTGGPQLTYHSQVDYPPDPSDPQRDPTKDLKFPLLVYLDVWERHITALEDDDIREVALGGPDTAARAKVVWQVKINQEIVAGADVAKLTCEGLDNEEKITALKKRLQHENLGMLRARAYVPENSGDVCIVSPESRYRGAENQLYRVEIHKGGKASDQPTFKWSRENGSTVYRIESLRDKANTVTLENLGRDARFGLEVGDWVEVVDDEYTLLGKAEPLLRVKAIEEMVVTLNKAPKSHVGQNQKRHPLLRRWDQQQGDSKIGGLTLTDGAAEIIERTEHNSHWLNLEDGVQVQFEPGATYRSGDYWLIPARTATGDVEWPGPADNPTPRPPNGVEHHYAPLALVYLEAATATKAAAFTTIDLRHRFGPLGQCCPTIKLIFLPTVLRSKTVTFEVSVNPQIKKLEYTWTVEGGTPTSGNGTTIQVTPDPNTAVTKVKATVTIDGLPAGCPNTFSGMCSIT